MVNDVTVDVSGVVTAGKGLKMCLLLYQWVVTNMTPANITAGKGLMMWLLLCQGW